MASAKLLDGMARMPGFDGQDADAVGAYMQVVLSEVDGSVGLLTDDLRVGRT